MTSNWSKAGDAGNAAPEDPTNAQGEQVAAPAATDAESEPREVGTVVDDKGLPYEVRKDGSIAYFTQEKAEQLLREVGS